MIFVRVSGSCLRVGFGCSWGLDECFRAVCGVWDILWGDLGGCAAFLGFCLPIWRLMFLGGCMSSFGVGFWF